MKARRKARRLALQIMYEMDCSGHSMEATFVYVRGYIHQEQSSKDFAVELVRGAWGHRAWLDQVILVMPRNGL